MKSIVTLISIQRPQQLFVRALLWLVVGSLVTISLSACLSALGTSTDGTGREITNLEYLSADGRTIKAVLSMPKGEGPFPVVVTIHGGKGGREISYIRTLAAPGEVSPTVNMLNEQPWAVLAISYRDGAIFGAEEDDVVAGIRFAKTLPRIDSTRIGILGGSHGGMLALRAAELMGKEIVCVAVGSPWMTNPKVVLLSDISTPPMSLLSPQALEWQLKTFRTPLLQTLERGRKMTKDEIGNLLSLHSIEENAEKISVPVLFLISIADIQVPHLLVLPTIEKLKTAKKDVTVYTAEKSMHGFYWGRDIDGGAQVGPKSPVQLREEERARAEILAFFLNCFAP